MLEQWRLFIDPAYDGATNMAIDEALLREIGARVGSPSLRLFRWEPACLSLGVGQSAKDADRDLIRQHGWHIVRRLTGGRAILHTDEITYSVTLPNDHPLVAGTIVESYRRISRGLLRALELLGMVAQAEPQALDAPKLTGPVCFEVPSNYEIAVDGKKMLGSAQVRKHSGMLQHGSLPLTGDLSRICDSLAFADEAERRVAKERVLSRAITLHDALGRVVAWDEAADAIIRAFEEVFSVELVSAELTSEERQLANELRVTRYATDEWTQRL
ncbi:MAG: lipoate--protein ligase family protein [Anaerolineae bacterium]|nr:lipoate--protein ligase family protein [Anaerolineae bacterium]